MSTLEDRERKLLIRTQRDAGNKVIVAVQDSGIGLDPRTAERIFDAFHTTKPGGLGMGLKISRSIVEWHKGRLCAAANEDHGATFQFSLPSLVDPDATDAG
jgi:signal transduction histidine kinase